METLSIPEAVQLAVAPIFLLAGIGAFLNVMTLRLSRVVDRARMIEGHLEEGEPEEIRGRHRVELKALGQRMTATNRAIWSTTMSALLICLVVALLFLQQLTPIPVGEVIALLFVATVLLLTVGLVFFLQEISVASRSLRVRQELLR